MMTVARAGLEPRIGVVRVRGGRSPSLPAVTTSGAALAALGPVGTVLPVDVVAMVTCWNAVEGLLVTDGTSWKETYRNAYGFTPVTNPSS